MNTGDLVTRFFKTTLERRKQMRKKLLSLLLIGAVIGGGVSSTDFKQETKAIKIEASNVVESNQLALEKSQDKRMSRGDTSLLDAPVVNNESVNKEAVRTTPSQSKDTAQADASEGVSKKEETSKIESINWWAEATKVFPRGTVAEVEDVYTGKKFKIKRTTGTNHADCETLTKEDTKIMKEIWGGFTWERRPVVLNINGRRLAASMAGMPHAGRDSAPALAVASNRSAGYGTGENLDFIKGNDMNGVFDVHFPGSTRHKDGKVRAVVDPEHQKAIQVAAQAK